MGLIVRWMVAVAFMVLLPASSWAQLRYFTLIDSDDDPTTGCTVTLPTAGTVTGIERRLTTTVSETASPPQVTQLTLERCIGGGFGSSVPLPGAPYPVGLNNGVNEADVVEQAAPIDAIATPGAAVRLYFAAQGPSSGDLLGSANGPPIVIETPPSSPNPVGIPALSDWGLLILGVLLLVALIRQRSRFPAGMMCVLLVGTLVGVAWAAGFRLDGQVNDWQNESAAGTDPAGDSIPATDIIAAFVAQEGGMLFSRLDIANIGGPPPPNRPPVFTSTPVTTANIASPYSYAIITSDPDGNILTLTAPTLPAWLTLTPGSNGRGTLSGTPGPTHLGANAVVLRVTDSGAPRLSKDQSFTITVNGAVHPVPILDLNGVAAGIDFAATFIEDGGAVAIVDPANLTVTDPDSLNLASATITLTNLLDTGQETLAVGAVTIAPNTPITAAYNAATGVLTLTGSATLAQYQAALRTVTYNNTAAAPTATPARTITFVVSDGGNASAPATATVTLARVNDAPSFTAANPPAVNEDGGAQTVNGWVTAFDPGPADEATQTVLAYTVSNVGNAALFSTPPSVNTSGTLSYTPAPNAFGASTFDVRVQDNGGTANGGVDTSAPQTFTITVNPVNDAPSFTAANPPAVNEDGGAQTVPGWATFNPGNPQESAQTVLAYTVSNVGNAALFSTPPSVNTSGTLSYTPAPNAFGASTFDVRVQDNGGTANGGVDTSAPQTFTITVAAVDDPPTAVNDLATVAEDSAATAIDVLANDTDTDGGPKLVNSVTQPANGAVAITNGGADLTYQPNPDYCNAPPGTTLDAFTYTLAPGGSTATVTVTVNCIDDAPVVDLNGPAASIDFAATFTEGGGAVVIVDAAALTTSDVDSTNLASATVTLTNLLDAGQETLSATVAGTSITANYVAATGVLTLTGPDTVANFQTVLRTVAYNNGSPNPNTTARVIQFVANDGASNSPVATSTVTVLSINSAPSFTKGADQTVDEDSGAHTANGWATAIGDGDGDTQTLTFNITNNTNAALFSAGPSISPTGVLTYTPAANANGSATITLVLKDDGGTANGGQDTSAPQTFVINVNPVNDAPGFTKGPDQTVFEDAGAQTVNPWATAISVGPANEAGQTLTFNITGNTNPGLFGAGPAISPAGVLTYTPAADASGSATITVTLQDNGGTANGGVDTSAPQSFTINVTAVDDPPTAVNDLATVAEDSAATAIDVLANDTDTDGGPKSIGSVTQPANGTVAITNSGADLTYQPDPNYCNNPPGTTLDTFTYTLTPGASTAAVAVTVTCVDDPPTAVDDPATVDEDSGASTIDVLANDTDPDAGPKLINSVTQPANGTVAITNGGADLTYQPNANYCNNPPGTTLDTFAYTLTPGSSTATVSVTVNCLNDAPVIALPDPTVAYDTVTPVILDAAATVIDIDSANFDTGVLTANVTTNCENNDRLGVRSEGAAPGQIGVSGADVTYNPGSGAVTIGTITTEFDCGTATPTLSIALNANADLTATQALLRNLIFFSSVTPPTPQRTIEVVLTDGDGGASNTATKAVDIDAAPAVNTIVPANNATGVAIDANVVITFSEDVTAPAAAFAISCATSGNHPFALGGGPASFTLNPNTDFVNGEVCTVTVTATQVTDQDTVDPPDAMTTDFTSTFTTVDVAPTVLASSIPANAAVVGINQTVTLDFSEAVNVVPANIALACNGNPVTFTSSATSNVTTVTLTPTTPLPEGANCTLNVPTNAATDEDSVDPPDELDAAFNRAFTVDTAPTFVSSNPANANVNVAVGSNIGVNFSEAVTVSNSPPNPSFTLDCGGGPLAYTLSGSGTNSIILDPSVNLLGGTSCTVTINGGSVSDTDTADPPDTMTTSPSFSFTTQSIAENDAYTVTPHLTLAVDTGVQSGRVTANDQLGSGVITGFGFTGSCNATAPGSQHDGGAANGRLTLNANGSFSYEPPAGVSNTTRTFCYTVSGGDTANIVFTLQNTELVWFVDAAAGAGGVGNQARPFQTLAAAAGADTANDTIFVKDNASAYTCGITLEANEKLIGEGSGSDLGALSGITPVAGSAFPGLTNNSADRPNLTAATDCITLASGNTLRGFILGNTTGAKIKGTNFGSFVVANAVLEGSGAALDLTNGTIGGGFDSVASTSSTDAINLNSVAGSVSLSGFAGAGISGATGSAIKVIGGSVGFTYNPGITHAGSGPMVSVSGGHTGSLTFQSFSLDATAGAGLSFDNADGTYTFNVRTSVSGGGGLSIANGSSGTFNFVSPVVSVTNATGPDVSITNSTANVTYNGSVSDNNNSAAAVSISGNTGGTISFNGAITANTGATNAINLDTNTGATINFTGGGLAISTTSGTGFNATGGGTVNVTGTGNTITSVSATALNVANTTIGASGLTFQSISAGNNTAAADPANGIVLNSTGASGGLTVTGTGTTDGTGGTIQNISNRGASFINASNITLKNMNFTNTATAAGAPCGSAAVVGANDGCNAAIHLNTVSTVALDNLNLTTSGQQGINGIAVTGFTLSNSALSGLGNGPDEDGLHFHNMLGTNSITNTTIASSGDDNVNIQNLVATASTINITGGSFNNGVQGSGLLFGIRGTSNTTINISGVTIDNNFSGGIVADSFDTATMKLDVTGITDSNNNDGIQVSGHNGSAQFDIHDNSDASPSSGLGIYNNDFLGATLLKSAFSTLGRLEGRITTTEITIPDQRTTDAILVFGAGGSDFRTAITDSTISYRGTQRAITVQGGQDGAAIMDTTITGNDIDIQMDGTNNAFGGILANVIIATPTGNGSTLCADIGGAGALGNVFTHSLGGVLAAGDIRVRQRNGGPVRLPGYGGTGSDNAAIAAYLDGRNGEVSPSTATNDNGLFSGGGACVVPVIP